MRRNSSQPAKPPLRILMATVGGSVLLGLLALPVRAAAPSAAQGVITAKAFLNIGGGTTVADLTGNAKFPDKPDLVVFAPYFEWNATGDITTAPGNYADNYGVQMVGYFFPPAAGDYVFWIASDDNSSLYLSTDDTAANKKLIARESSWSNAREYTVSAGGSDLTAKDSSQFAATAWPTKDPASGGAKITLTKGKGYYIEALMKEGSGGDFLSVAVRAPDYSIDETMPIPGQYLATIDKTTGPAKFAAQPQSISVVEGQPATFSVVADGTPPYTYQWQKGSADIVGETNATLVLPRVTLSDNNAKFTCKLSNSLGSATSDAATLTVTPDTTAPTVVKVSADTTFTSVVVKYSEPVGATAEVLSNYAIDQGATISAVTRVDAQTVTLTTSTLTGGVVYTLTINNVKDTAVTPNTIAPNTKVEVRPFVFMPGMVVHQKYNNVDDGTGGSINGLFDDPRFPGAPDRVDLLTMFEYPANGATRDANADPVRDYFDCIEGLFIPPVTGNYVFFISFADRCWLYLSTDETPANKYQVLGLSGWSDPRDWNSSYDYDVTQARSDMATANQYPGAPTIHLTKDKKYYMLLAHHDPSWAGGDWFAATYKLENENDPLDGDVPKLTGSVIGTYLDPTGASVTFSQQPQSVSVEDGKTATFSVAATGTSLYGSTVTYQWQTAPKSSSTWTDIAGAKTSSYTTPVLSAADDGKQFRVAASVPGYTAFSAVATLTVVSDTVPPKLVGATAFSGATKIGLMFDEALDAASAAIAANYKVNGAAIASAMVRTNVANEKTNEKNLVQLTVSTPVTADFTLTISGVKDIKGNAMAETTATGKILNLTSTDIGSPAGEPGGPDPLFPSTVTTWGPGAFDVLCNGNDYWNNADGFNFIWEPKTNSFDVKVRVVSISPINHWSAGAIEVREGPPTPNGGGWELARHYFVKTDYGGEGVQVLDNSGQGANAYEFNARLAPGDPTIRETGNGAPGGSVGWGGTGPGNPGPPAFPNAWIRIKRDKQGTNDHLIAFTSSDGLEWSERMNVDLNDANHAGFLDRNNQPAGPWPDVCYVGLGSTSHTGVGNGNQINDGSVGSFWYSPVGQPYGCFVIYRDYGDFSAGPAPGAEVRITGGPAGVTITFTGTLQWADQVTGPWTDMAGSSPQTVVPTGAARFYRSKQ